jgi:Zn-dependent protease
MMDDFSFGPILYQASIWVLPVLIAITLHEAAHGWVAWRLGDDTAYVLGRVTFNPFRHIDPFGTVIMPALLLFLSGGRLMFGYAKPVPVNFWRLNRPRRDMVLVAAAGPGVNLALAFASAAAMYAVPWLSGDLAKWVFLNLKNSVWMNALLCVFNLLPIPPLDGGRIAVGLLPDSFSRPLARLERVGILIVLLGLFVLPWLGGQIGVSLDVFWWLVGGPAEYLSRVVYAAVGIR